MHAHLNNSNQAFIFKFLRLSSSISLKLNARLLNHNAICKVFNKILQIFNENFEDNNRFSFTHMRIVEAFIRVE